MFNFFCQINFQFFYVHLIQMLRCQRLHTFLHIFHRKVLVFVPALMISATGSRKKDAVKSAYPAGKHQKSLKHGSSIPSEIFRQIPLKVLCSLAGTGRKVLEKSGKFPTGILLPQYHRNDPEPLVSRPGCSTWVIISK